jgi:hypothetical protein
MSYLFSRRYKQKCRTFCGLLFRNTHLLPINKPLSLVVEFNGKGYDLTLVSLERLGISVFDYLLLCSGNTSVLCKFKLDNVDIVFKLAPTGCLRAYAWLMPAARFRREPDELRGWEIRASRVRSCTPLS